jgi:hypothetical protein
MPALPSTMVTGGLEESMSIYSWFFSGWVVNDIHIVGTHFPPCYKCSWESGPERSED